MDAKGRKDADKIKSELLREFESGNVDRVAAVVELNSQRHKSDELPQTLHTKKLLMKAAERQLPRTIFF